MLDAYASFSGELADTAQRVLRQPVDRRAGAPGQAPGRVLRVHGAVASSVPVAQLDVAPARRAHARARARPRPARVPRTRAGRVPPGDAAHARRDRVGVRRDGHLRPAARDGDRSRGTAHAARREPRGPDRDRVPPDRDEPLRARDAHRPARGGRAVGRAARRALVRLAARDARRLGRGHRRLPHVVVVHPALHRHARLRVRVRVRPAARAVGVRALRGGGERLRVAATSTCCARAARSRPRSSARWSASTSPIPAFWDRGLDIIERRLEATIEAATAAGRLA